MVVYSRSSVWEDGANTKHKVIGDSQEDKKGLKRVANNFGLAVTVMIKIWGL